MKRFLQLAVAGSFAVAPAFAQSRFAPLDSAFNTMRSGSATPAVAMAVVYRDSLIYSNVAGFADLERQVRANSDTRFDWASIAKQFTAFAVSQLVESGRVRVTDPARKHLPELDLGGSEVTIDQLLHHTSGLEDTDGLYALSGGRNGDPIAHDDLVRLLLQQQHVRFAPGSQHAYSNGGYTLLAEIVTRASGQSFAAFTDSAIFRPLGMHSSGFLDGPFQMVPNRALPYVRHLRDGTYRLSTSDTYPGAGGLFASIGDMAQWMRHLLRPTVKPAATFRLREHGRLSNGDSLGYAWGIGWSTFRGHASLQHAGSGPASAAHLLVIPELEFGVVAAIAGDVEINPATIAFQAAELLLGSQLAAPNATPMGSRMFMMTMEMLSTRPVESLGVTVPRELLERLAGRYLLPDSTLMIVRARGDVLEYAVNGRWPYIQLFPLPDGRFVMVPLWDAYRFELPPAGPALRVIREKTPRSMRAAGATPVVGVRQSERRFSQSSAAPFVGWYYSDELKTTYEVAFRNGALELVHARHGRLPLVPLDSVRFAVEGGGIAGASFAPQGDRMIGMELQAVSWGVAVSFRRVAMAP